ncbi:hypothetical protein Tco_1398122 [Tanacetum coccineum]
MGSEEVEGASDGENEVLNAEKRKKEETMKRKTKAYNSKKLRNNRSEEEEQTNRNQKRISSPKALYEAMSGLSKERKKCLKEIGFKRYIHFPIVELPLPSTLAYHVIENFHTPTIELQLQKGSIKATWKKVQDRLSIPMGKTKLQDLEQRPANNPFIAEWEAQYSHLGKTTPHNCFANLSTIGTLENGGRVPTKLLKCIKEEDDIADIDWCRYIMDCLHTNLHIICHTPAIRSCNTLMMRKRIMMETSQRCLGNQENQGKFNPEEEQIGIDLYKGFDVYIEPLNNRKPVTKEYKELFNDAEFNLYESSKDGDSDSDRD